MKTGRLQENNTLAFIDLNDGSSQKNLQVVVKDSVIAHSIDCNRQHAEGMWLVGPQPE